MELCDMNLDLTREWLEYSPSAQQFNSYQNYPSVGFETSNNYVAQSNIDYNYNTDSYSYYSSYSPNINENYTQQHCSYDQTLGSSSQQEKPSPVSNNSAQDDFFEIDHIINNNELVDDELHEVLSTAGLSDFLNDNTSFYSDSSSSTSASSTPKRKYSTDSSSDCLSFSSYDTTSPASSDGNTVKPKRFRRSKHTKEERIVRKKDQNKKAASKYRIKKKDEKQDYEQTLSELEGVKQQFSAQIEKLRTEFNVILPLAKAAFSLDSSRNQQLAQLIQRLDTNNLL